MGLTATVFRAGLFFSFHFPCSHRFLHKRLKLKRPAPRESSTRSSIACPSWVGLHISSCAAERIQSTVYKRWHRCRRTRRSHQRPWTSRPRPPLVNAQGDAGRVAGQDPQILNDVRSWVSRCCPRRKLSRVSLAGRDDVGQVTGYKIAWGINASGNVVGTRGSSQPRAVYTPTRGDCETSVP
jgi:hypothetical protein